MLVACWPGGLWGGGDAFYSWGTNRWEEGVLGVSV